MSGKKPSAVRRCTGGTGTPSPSGAAAARAHRGWLLTVMCVGMFLVLLDVTVVNVALPTISGDLGSSLSGLQWVVDAYSVVFAALLLPAGTLGDVLGHKHMAIAGLVMFGVGAALLLPATMAVITHAFPGRREQARALGVWAGVSSLAVAAGPIIGGVVVTTAGWRAVFWVNLPLVAAALVGTAVIVSGARHRVARRLDLPGAATAVIGLGATVFVVINAGHAGMTPSTWAAIGVAALAATGFVYGETRAADPMLPLGLLRTPAFTGANLVAGAMNLVGIGSIFVLTLYLQDVQGRSALAGGLALLPLFVPLAALSPLTGKLTARVGPRPPMTAGLLLGAVGSACLLLVHPASGYAALLPTFAGLGLGMGLLTAAVVAAAMHAAPPERSGLASGVNNTARQVGGALGIAVYGALAGSPDHPGRFVAGLHDLALLGATGWIVAAVVTLVTVGRTGPARGAGDREPPCARQGRPAVSS